MWLYANIPYERTLFVHKRLVYYFGGEEKAKTETPLAGKRNVSGQLCNRRFRVFRIRRRETSIDSRRPVTPPQGIIFDRLRETCVHKSGIDIRGALNVVSARAFIDDLFITLPPPVDHNRDVVGPVGRIRTAENRRNMMARDDPQSE